MKQRKKREYQSSELVKAFAKIYGFENKLLALEVKSFLAEYMGTESFKEIEKVDLKQKKLIIIVKPPILRNDLQFKRSFLLKKIKENFGEDTFETVEII